MKFQLKLCFVFCFDFLVEQELTSLYEIDELMVSNSGFGKAILQYSSSRDKSINLIVFNYLFN